MCLVAKGKRKKAREDIVCYKVLRMDVTTNELSSPYYNMQWKKGEEYENKEKAKIKFPNHIENGYFHTYELEYDAFADCGNYTATSHNAVFEVMIPKGSYYYEGTHYGRRGYASKKLKIIRIVF